MRRLSLSVVFSFWAFCSQASGQTGMITTVAGNGYPGGAGDGGPAMSALLNTPQSVVVDAFGNLFIADTDNNRIRKVSASGIISTVAGEGYFAFSGDGGPAISAALNTPQSVAVDASGNLFIADTGNNRIRKVSANGIITTVAGNGIKGFSGDGGPATSAELNGPNGIAVDASGNLFIADTFNNRIRKVSANGIISTVAGNGTEGFSGDGGPATLAELSDPSGVAVDSSGNLFIADRNNSRVRKVSTNGIISTVAGKGDPGVFFDNAGYSGDGGPATSAALAIPMGIAVDASGNLFVADTYNNRIRRVSAGGIISTVAGVGVFNSLAYNECCQIDLGSGDGGPATAATLDYPSGVAVDGSGNIFIADTYDGRIREVLVQTSISTAPNAPVVTAGGIVNASFYSGALPASPGSLISIFGSNLSSSTGSAAVDSSGHIPLTLAGASVQIGSISAPLLFVSPTQINAQVPFELPPRAYAVTVTTAAGVSNSIDVNVTATSPGMFAVVNNATGALIDAGNPFRPGDVIVIYCTGLGAVSPSGVSGQVAPDNPISFATATPTVTIGGVPVQVANAVLSPGFVGLYQIGIVVPDGLPPGAQPLVVTSGGVIAAPLQVVSAPSLNPQYCADVSGAWNVTQSGNLTEILTSAPENDNFTDPFSSQGSIVISQTGCSISYTPAPVSGLVTQAQAASLVRTGTVVGNTVSLAGLLTLPTLAVANLTGLTVTQVSQNQFQTSGPLTGAVIETSDSGNFTGAGTYSVSGQSGSFTITYILQGTSTLVRPGVGTVAPAGTIKTFAGNGIQGFSGDGGAARSAELYYPHGIAVDASGNLFFADTYNERIRRVSANGIISTIAGGRQGFSGDGGPATSAALDLPFDVAVDASGNVFISDSFNNRIRKVSAGGVISTVAGNGTVGSLGDGGPATLAKLAAPRDIAVDSSGNLFIADEANNRIRKVSPNGIISTVAGNGTEGFSGDGGPATLAELSGPYGIAVDPSGNLFIGDAGNNLIRKVSASGIISTVAGNGSSTFSGDGGPAISAGFNGLFGFDLALDASGNLLICENFSGRIRQVSTGGTVTTLAGGGGYSGAEGDGGPATAATFSYPDGIALDASGNLFIADEGDNRIREVIAYPIAASLLAQQANAGSSTAAGFSRGRAFTALLPVVPR